MIRVDRVLQPSTLITYTRVGANLRRREVAVWWGRNRRKLILLSTSVEAVSPPVGIHTSFSEVVKGDSHSSVELILYFSL